jgi:hypothetical protein
MSYWIQQDFVMMGSSEPIAACVACTLLKLASLSGSAAGRPIRTIPSRNYHDDKARATGRNYTAFLCWRALSGILMPACFCRVFLVSVFSS